MLPPDTVNEAIIQKAIRRWERLLQCGQCGALPESTQQLIMCQESCQRPICIDCWRTQNDCNTPRPPSLCQVLTSNAAPFGTDADPFRVVHVLKQLLHYYPPKDQEEEEEEKQATKYLHIQEEESKATKKPKQDSSSSATSTTVEKKSAYGLKFTTCDDSKTSSTVSPGGDDDIQRSSGRLDKEAPNAATPQLEPLSLSSHKYASLNPNFFLESLRPPDTTPTLFHHEEGSTGIVARNCTGGRAYYGKRKRRSLQTTTRRQDRHILNHNPQEKDDVDPRRLDQKNDDEFEFKLSQSRGHEEDSQEPRKMTANAALDSNASSGEGVSSQCLLGDRSSGSQLADEPARTLPRLSPTAPIATSTLNGSSSPSITGNAAEIIERTEETVSSTTILLLPKSEDRKNSSMIPDEAGHFGPSQESSENHETRTTRRQDRDMLSNDAQGKGDVDQRRLDQKTKALPPKMTLGDALEFESSQSHGCEDIQESQQKMTANATLDSNACSGKGVSSQCLLGDSSSGSQLLDEYARTLPLLPLTALYPTSTLNGSSSPSITGNVAEIIERTEESESSTIFLLKSEGCKNPSISDKAGHFGPSRESSENHERQDESSVSTIMLLETDDFDKLSDRNTLRCSDASKGNRSLRDLQSRDTNVNVMTFPEESTRVQYFTKRPKVSDGLSFADGNTQESVSTAMLPETCDFLKPLGGNYTALQAVEESSDKQGLDAIPSKNDAETVEDSVSTCILLETWDFATHSGRTVRLPAYEESAYKSGLYPLPSKNDEETDKSVFTSMLPETCDFASGKPSGLRASGERSEKFAFGPLPSKNDEESVESISTTILPETCDLHKPSGAPTGLQVSDESPAKESGIFPVAGENIEDTEESVSTAMLPETADFLTPSERKNVVVAYEKSGDQSRRLGESSESIEPAIEGGESVATNSLPEIADFDFFARAASSPQRFSGQTAHALTQKDEPFSHMSSSLRAARSSAHHETGNATPTESPGDVINEPPCLAGSPSSRIIPGGLVQRNSDLSPDAPRSLDRSKSQAELVHREGSVTESAAMSPLTETHEFYQPWSSTAEGDEVSPIRRSRLHPGLMQRSDEDVDFPQVRVGLHSEPESVETSVLPETADFEPRAMETRSIVAVTPGNTAARGVGEYPFSGGRTSKWMRKRAGEYSKVTPVDLSRDSEISSEGRPTASSQKGNILLETPPSARLSQQIGSSHKTSSVIKMYETHVSGRSHSFETPQLESMDSRLLPQTDDFMPRDTNEEGDCSSATPGKSYTKRLILADAIPESELQGLKLLHLNGGCTLLNSEESVNMQRSDPAALSASNVYLMVHSEAHAHPFASAQNGKEKCVQVCFPTYKYLKARALGWPIISTRWLHNSNADEQCSQEDCEIWGDFSIYAAVVNGSPWLSAADWWTQTAISPCESSTKESLLASFKFVVLDDGMETSTREHDVIPDDVSLPSMKDCHQETAPAQNCSAPFSTLSGHDVRTLCRLLRSQVMESVTETSGWYIVLVPDLIEEEQFVTDWFPKLMRKKSIPQGGKLNVDCKKPQYRASRVKFVYFSWLVDTISANVLAPIRPHCLGFLEP
jgi:hypothetical protein